MIPDSICCICGSFTIGSQRASISVFLSSKSILHILSKNLGIKTSGYKPWVPHKVCKHCVESLRMWTKGTRDKLTFGVPMVWRKSNDHCTNCYFCLVKYSTIQLYNKKDKCKMDYTTISYRSIAFVVCGLLHNFQENLDDVGNEQG